VLKRAARAYRRHGFIGFWILLAQNVVYHLRRLGRPAEKDPLDATLGVETSEIREVGSLDIDSPNVVHAVRYQPSYASIVRRSLQGCGIDYPEFVFIDFGCGKGRVMLLAAEFGFRRIVGVEFSPELCRIARENITAARDRLGGCRDLRVMLGDAAAFELPDDPLVCYFYNPFGEPVLREVLANIERSLARTPRPIVIIYVDPVHRRVLDGAGPWTAAVEDGQYVMYRNRAPGPDA
jgi:SAM-dependent methyltransferase